MSRIAANEYIHPLNYSPGLNMPPPMRGPSPRPPQPPSHSNSLPSSQPPPHNPQWSPWAPPIQQNASLSFNGPHRQHPPAQHRSSVAVSMYGPPPKPPSPPTGDAPSLVAPIPTIPALHAAVQAIQQPNYDPTSKVAWARDVVFLVNRAQQNTSTDPLVGPATITDPQLLRLVHVAVPVILEMASRSQQSSMAPHIAEAIYLRATFAASGAFPDYLRQNLRSAFRDFETAARAGYASAWFRLGRDYESFNDFQRARDCFERGVKHGVESCCYRMGMAHLMGQLSLPASPEQALPLLYRAATLASLDSPQPAYVFALIMLGEFTQASVPAQSMAPFIPAGSSAQVEARKHLERAAYLHFSPAQYKLGHAFEFAEPPFSFDALLSVQYYSLASQQGEVEADMALSKWFLCGSGDDPSSPGHFDKDEALAWTFADKAARRGLPSAEFAMGYYAEVGVGGPKDLQTAIRWYTKAKEHGNADAAERLTALDQSVPQALSRQEHDVITEDKLVRKRTQAKMRSDAQRPQQAAPPPQISQQIPQPEPYQPQQRRHSTQQVVDLARRTSMLVPQSHGQGHSSRMSAVPEGGTPHGTPHGTPPPQQLPSMSRYTLTDNPVPPGGVNAISGPGRSESPGRGRGYGRGGRVVTGGVGVVSPANNLAAHVGHTEGVAASSPSPKPSKGPTTFAEMGIQGTRAEDKECVIM
ncbi:hypothetical protein AX17_002961 [Amanita inopinata Kibby_2008]|nr:hypothetical protein AX17_002961 [Amanita inopinata Kibby_2008]